MNLYRSLVRPLLFRADPEWMHDRAIAAAALASRSRWLCSMVNACQDAPDERLSINVAGLFFRNPLGLAAGFDKNGRAAPLLAALGFSHVEIGSISAHPSAGNPRPRLFRLPGDQAIVVNYGLPNDGAAEVAHRIDQVSLQVPLGVNVVNTNRGAASAPESDDAVVNDYVASLQQLMDRGDYLCLNLSCPNTPEGRGFFADSDRLRRLLDDVGALRVTKPLFLKIAPFGSVAALESFLAAVEPATFVRGFAINLAAGKPPGLTASAEKLQQMPGAVSGRPSSAAANVAIREIYRNMDRRRYSIIGTGGIFSAADAYEKIRLGASLVQLMTGLIYEGPGIAKAINRGLARLLERDGFRNVSEAVGVDSRD